MDEAIYLALPAFTTSCSASIVSSIGVLLTAPIIGATKLTHLEDAVAALSVKLDSNEIASLEEPYVPHQVYGN